jgi:diguanylate cyclase (GGDEF)-like protein
MTFSTELGAVSRSFLAQVLRQTGHLGELVKRSASELSAVNTAVKGELADHPLSGVELAFRKNEIVIGNLQDASEVITAMNQALEIETRDRTMIEHQLAAAIEQEEGARNAALHDDLTGLANRVLFWDRLEHGIAQAKRHRWMLAVMFVDLDHFKSINDTHGHQAGDAVLQTVAMRLMHSTRGEDTVSRYGGDEFLCVLTHPNEQKDILVIAAKLLKAIREPCNVSVHDVVINPCLEASIGIAVYPRDGATASALIRSADEAMFRAKRDKSGYAFAQ